MSYKLPNNYRRSARCSQAAYLKDFEHFLYVNLDTPVSDSNFSDWRLDLYDQYGNQTVTNIGTLVKNVVLGSTFNFYTTLTIPSGTANGLYYLVVIDSTDNTLIYQSKAIKVISTAELTDYAYVLYKNSISIFNQNYTALTNYNNVFLELNMIDRQPEIELTQYTEASTGKVRSQIGTSQSIVIFEAYFFDDDMNNGMHALSMMDDIVINGKAMTVKTPYTIEVNKINSIQKGTIELYDQEFGTINRNQ